MRLKIKQRTCAIIKLPLSKGSENLCREALLEFDNGETISFDKILVEHEKD